MKILYAVAVALVLLAGCAGDYPVDIDSLPKQQYIYFLTDTTDDVSREYQQYYCRIKPDGTARKRLMRLWNTYGSAHFSPNGLKVVVGSQIMNVNGTSRRFFFYGSKPRWSPDSRTLAYTVGQYVTDSICVTAVADDKQKFVATDKSILTLAWMPDSKRIVYSTRDGMLRTVQKDGTEKTVLLKTDSLYIESLAAVSDKIIFYYRNPSFSGGGLGVVKIDGSDLRLFADFPYFTISDVSRNNKELLISVYEDKFYNIFTLNTETLLKKQLTSFKNAEAIRASYSPDGAKLVIGTLFAPSQYTKFSRIFSMNADGHNLKALSADTTRTTAPRDNLPGWGLQ